MAFLLCAMMLMSLAACSSGSDSGSSDTTAADSGSTAASDSEAAGEETTGAAAASTDYPKMAITINTSKSGSAVDYGARAFAKILGEKLDCNVVVNSTSGQVEGCPRDNQRRSR
ncbi:MAG: hypothetical protein LUE23_11720, partial [Lachnospiraceae bacterium]|nr:hypothetical protein [Lachnospiraceae bacterium]